MTALHEQLEHVADQATGQPVPDAEALWTRGHRWRRRRRVGTAAVAGTACLALVGLGLADWQTSREDELRPSGSPAGLPDRVWEPSPNLPGTKDTGPLGRLALTMTADRAGWRGTDSRTVGVSAESGRYAFLDLPRQAHESTALSPDGRYLAYWATGTPSGSPPDNDEVITGFAVYDAETGAVRVQDLETEHGVWPDTLTFADDDTLVAQISQRIDQSTARFAPLWVWDLTEDEAAEDLSLDDAVNGHELDGGGHGFVWWIGDGGSVHQVVDVHQAVPAARSVPVRSGMMGYTAAVDSSGQRVAAIPGDRNPNRVTWGSASEPERVVPESSRTSQVLAWIDAEHILVLRSPNGDYVNPGLWVLDVNGGDAREIVSPVGERDEFGDPVGTVLDCCATRDVAWELATAPTFKASEPPDPIDRRVLLGGSLAAILAAVIALRQWRRRVHP